MSDAMAAIEFVEVELQRLGTMKTPHYWRGESSVVWCDGGKLVGVFATDAQRAQDVAATIAVGQHLAASCHGWTLFVDARRFGGDAGAFTATLRGSTELMWRWSAQNERAVLLLPHDWTATWWLGLTKITSWGGMRVELIADVEAAFDRAGVTPEVGEALAVLRTRLQSEVQLGRNLEELLRRSPGLSIDEASRDLGWSPRTLQRALAQRRSTFLEVRSRVRRELAAELLRRSDDKLASVARSVGFSSRSHFVRWFREETGQTPSAYRARAGGQPIAASEGD